MACACEIVPKFRLRLNNLNSRYGRCVHFNGNLTSTLQSQISSTPKADGEHCIQMFLGSPKGSDCAYISETDKASAKAFCDSTQTTFYAHCPYTANLGGNPGVAANAKRVVANYLSAVNGLPGAAVLHIGAVNGIGHVAASLQDMIAHDEIPVSHNVRLPYHLLLESSAGQGTQLGKTWEEIRKLYEACDRTRIGVCIDTQHVFASGMSNLTTHEDVVKLFDTVYNNTGQNISLLHINDSEVDFCDRKDRHAPLGDGHIWAQDDTVVRFLNKSRTGLLPLLPNALPQIPTNNHDGLFALIARCREHNIDIISETSNPARDVQLMHAIDTSV